MTDKRWLTLVVDRFEGSQAVLLSDEDTRFDIKRADLPVLVSEGIVLEVPLSDTGAPLWAEAKVNDVATQQRLEEARRLLDRLRNKGQG